jgi:hypothetical protein
VAKEKKDLDFVTFEFLGQCDLLQAKKTIYKTCLGCWFFPWYSQLGNKKPVSDDSHTIHNNILDSNEASKLAPLPKAQNPSKYLCKAATELSAKTWVCGLAIKDVAAM